MTRKAFKELAASESGFFVAIDTDHEIHMLSRIQSADRKLPLLQVDRVPMYEAQFLNQYSSHRVIVKAVSCGHNHSIALDTDCRAYTWGSNSSG